jgi:argininosuccinate synthase
VTVDVADASEAGHDLLADVATFGGTDCVRFKPGFGREGVGSDICSPKRKATTDAEGFPI